MSGRRPGFPWHHLSSASRREIGKCLIKLPISGSIDPGSDPGSASADGLRAPSFDTRVRKSGTCIAETEGRQGRLDAEPRPARSNRYPGETLADELAEIGVRPSHLARAIGVEANRISQILNGKRAITADTSLRLARYFGQSEDFWLDLQKRYELDLARQEIGEALEGIAVYR